MKPYSAIRLVFVLLIVCLSLDSYAEKIVFIINSQNPASSISKNDIRDYYFKRKRQWPNGANVRFIDRAANSQLRKEFTKEFLNRTEEDLDLYWIGQKLYSGDSAPLKESSDRMTIQFVTTFEGAIGYISSDSAINTPGVKIIKTE